MLVRSRVSRRKPTLLDMSLVTKNNVVQSFVTRNGAFFIGFYVVFRPPEHLE